MAAAACGGVGIGHLLRKSMDALRDELHSAREKTTEGLAICPTHDGLAVQARGTVLMAMRESCDGVYKHLGLCTYAQPPSSL